MPSNPPRGWPHEAAYRYLEGATGAEIAWEWLRRDPAYRRLASTGIGRAETCIGSMRAASPVEQARWGCLNIPSPDRTWAESPVLWSSSLDSSVLDVIAVPARGENEHAFDLRRWSRISTLLSSRDREHLLLQGPRQSIRIDVLSGTSMPVRSCCFTIWWGPPTSSRRSPRCASFTVCAGLASSCPRADRRFSNPVA
jgi:hypothetical protein